MNISLDPGAYPPEKAHVEDAGFDLRTPHDFVVPAGGSAVIDTGIHVQIPRGCVGMLKSKSGLNVKYGITGEGVIDEGYSGAICVKLYNHSSVDYAFKQRDKIIQLVILPVVDVGEIFELPSLPETAERGGRGFGSTGR